jgi:hypothetical protein
MMDTLSEVMNVLRERGYTEDFNLEENCLSCRDGECKVSAGEFVIDKVYRFEGESNPDDEASLYAISSATHDVKGILVNGGGIYTDNITDAMLECLQIKRK